MLLICAAHKPSLASDPSITSVNIAHPLSKALPFRSQVPKAAQDSQVLRAQVALLDQDCARLVNPDYTRPFASIDDAVDRLLPYHVRRAALALAHAAAGGGAQQVFLFHLV